ncbi:MAG TPA: cupin-like domain-containing protein [Rhizomicrobium sp.]|nr:cupin-like domain-containing protein [Rhizomicrobium sp.]
MPGTTLNNVPGMKTATPVPVLRVEDLREDVFMRDYVSGSRPCVIRGAVRHWPATRKWPDRDYLKSRSGHHSVYYYPYEFHISAKKMESERATLTFAEAMDRLHARETKVAIVVTAAPSELLSDLGRVSFLSRAEPAFTYPPARYFFYRNAGTTWHYHPFDETLMCQVVGTKKIGLLNTNTPFNKAVSRIFFKEDYYNDPSAFDGLDGADLPWFSATLEPGDSLYIPPLWWHGIVPLSENFGATATVTWRSPLHVDANAIRKLASGDIHMIGGADPSYFPPLLEVARKTGLERELQIGWKRQSASVL